MKLQSDLLDHPRKRTKMKMRILKNDLGEIARRPCTKKVGSIYILALFSLPFYQCCSSLYATIVFRRLASFRIQTKIDLSTFSQGKQDRKWIQRIQSPCEVVLQDLSILLLSSGDAVRSMTGFRC